MPKCRIKKWVKTSKGLALPGPKLVELPDDEARRLAEKGDVEIVEENVPPVKMDRRLRKQMTR